MRLTEISSRLISPFNYPLTPETSVRVYPDSSPRNLEISDLHKGLILVYRGAELVGEGAGFGVPVVIYKDKTFFSSHAETFVEDNGDSLNVMKRYLLDTVSMKKMKNGVYINDFAYHALHGVFHAAYIRVKPLRSFFDGVMAFRRTVGVQTHFIQVEPRGTAEVRFEIYPNQVQVQADFGLKQDYQEIMMLNEQGASFFNMYKDLSGLELVEKEIGGWDKIVSSRASLHDVEHGISFTLNKPNHGLYYRGWENIDGRLSWAGINYSIPRNTSNHIEYVIDLELPGQLNKMEQVRGA